MGMAGEGQTIIIFGFDASPTIQSDLNTFSSLLNLNSTTIKMVYPPLNTSAPAGIYPGFDFGFAVEETLDTQAVHGVAPGAAITYVGANLTGTDAQYELALNYVLEKNLGNIVTNSYSADQSCVNGKVGDPTLELVITDILMQGAVLGVGFYFSSGM